SVTLVAPISRPVSCILALCTSSSHRSFPSFPTRRSSDLTVITPVFYFARVHDGMDGGVMITASHNPPEFNGFKLAHGFGTIYGGEIQAVRRLAEAGETVSGRGVVEERDVVPAYRKMLKQKITLGPRRRRVVLDCGNGTASLIGPQ